VLDYPARCNRLVLACTYAFNMATLREKLEGYLVPVLLRTLGMRRFSRLMISQGLKHLDTERAAWVERLIGDQDRDLMLAGWKELMRFDSRRRLAAIKCPTLVLAAAKDYAVPFHHAMMLHEDIANSRLAIIDGATHALIWERPEEFVRVVDKFLEG
jgi:3-oxoadipate enol-lactonase